MNINGLMSLLGQQWQNAAPEPVTSNTLDPQAAAPVASPAAVYHGSTPSGSDEPPTYDSSGMEVWMFDQAAWEKADTEMRDLWWGGGFSAPLGEMRYGYEDAMAKLSPELAAKDWGFSIKNDNLVIVAGKDPLSLEEMATLQKALGDLETLAKTLAANVIRYLELERGTDGVSEGLGRFDLSQANFDQIVDLRELLLSHGEDAKYGRHALEPDNYHKLYRAAAGHAITDQITANAKERFLATARQRDYQTRVY
jgi:hypothetical protein